MAGPAAPPPPPAAALQQQPPRRPQRRQQQRQQQAKGGLAGPELQLVEERLLELQFGLLSLHDDDADADEQREEREREGASKALMAECAAWFHPEHFAAVVEERASLGQCGYPPCRHALGDDRLNLRPGQKIIDARQKRIVDVTRETTMFCSDPCEQAARRYASRLSTEAPLFRPAARAYVLARKEAAEMGKGGVVVGKGPSLVYELVKKAHGGGTKKGEAEGEAGEGGAPPPAPQQEKEKEEREEQQRPHIRPKLRSRRPPLPPSAAKAAAATAAVEKGKGKRKEEGEKAGGGGAGAKAPGTGPRPPPPQQGGGGKSNKPGGGGGPLRMEVVERAAPEAPQPLSVWVAKGAEIEGHVVGVVARPSHQPVAELLAEVNNANNANNDDNDDSSLGDVVVAGEEGEGEEGGEEEVDGPAAAAAAAGAAEGEALPGDKITTEDALGWAPSTEIDVASLPSVVDGDFFMQVWTSVSDWLTGESRAFVRRVAVGGEEEGAVLADLLSRSPEAQARRRLLDAQRRQVALGQVLAPHLAPATDALRPLLLLLSAGGESPSVSLSPATVTARVQGLLATLDLGRALPAFLSSKHYEALALLFIDAAVAGGAGGAALQQQEAEEAAPAAAANGPLRRCLQRVGLSPAEYRCVLGDFELPE